MTELPEGLSYIPGFLTAGDQEGLVHELSQLSFTHDRFRGQPLKRSYAQFGFEYGSTGRRLLPAPPFPDFLTSIVEKAGRFTPLGARFNQCIIAHYPKGAGIGWHTDAEYFGDCILAVSLAGAARLQFRPNGVEKAAHELLVAPGSLYVMTGRARQEYQHRVVPVRMDRYALTCRHAGG